MQQRQNNHRRLVRIAGKLAETFGDADALESTFVLRRAAMIIDDRRDLGGHPGKPDWSYQGYQSRVREPVRCRVMLPVTQGE